jgi:hypothetical protein
MAPEPGQPHVLVYGMPVRALPSAPKPTFAGRVVWGGAAAPPAILPLLLAGLAALFLTSFARGPASTGTSGL